MRTVRPRNLWGGRDGIARGGRTRSFHADQGNKAPSASRCRNRSGNRVVGGKCSLWAMWSEDSKVEEATKPRPASFLRRQSSLPMVVEEQRRLGEINWGAAQDNGRRLSEECQGSGSRGEASWGPSRQFPATVGRVDRYAARIGLVSAANARGIGGIDSLCLLSDLPAAAKAIVTEHVGLAPPPDDPPTDCPADKTLPGYRTSSGETIGHCRT